jgi:leader peptidase (prepilin peptidase) / N-methyltransferase
MSFVEPIPSLFFFVIGLLLGSFFNVLIYRLPREESIVFPGSHCPHCGHPLSPWENIPVFSFIVLRGKCSYCKESISPAYPFVELLTGCASLALWRFCIIQETTALTTSWQIPVIALQALTLLSMIPIFVIDLKHFIIPDILTIPGIVLSFIFSFFPGGIAPVGSILGIAAGGGSLLAVVFFGKYILKKEAMGGGDVFLMAMAGALWGWKIAFACIVIGSFLGSIIGGICIALGRMQKDQRIPFGPFLAAGLWISVLTIDKLSAWYFHFLDRCISG